MLQTAATIKTHFHGPGFGNKSSNKNPIVKSSRTLIKTQLLAGSRNEGNRFNAGLDASRKKPTDQMIKNKNEPKKKRLFLFSRLKNSNPNASASNGNNPQ